MFLRAWHVDRPHDVQESPLTHSRTTLGRGVGNDIQLDVAGVSRHHTVVTVDGPRVVVADSGSTNGTWVKGRRIERAELGPGDSFQIGSMVFELATSSLVSPTVVEDWRGLQPPSASLVPAIRIRPAATTATVTSLDASTDLPLQPARPVPARGLTLGRDATNDLVLADDDVSRFHALVEPRAEAFMLLDLGSRNGTWVGDLRVREHLLAHGERFRIGNSHFVFHVPEQPAPSAGSATDADLEPAAAPLSPEPPTMPIPADVLAQVAAAYCPACREPMPPDDDRCASCGAERHAGPP